MKKFLKEHKRFILLGIFVFLFMYIFFTTIHPIAVFDGDDWTFMSDPRSMMPIWEAWNPSRVLPEILMPLSGSISAFIVYPITHDYVGSYTIVTSFWLAVVTAVYIFMFAKMIIKKFKLGQSAGIMLSLVFFFLHFLLFIINEVNNEYIFTSPDVTFLYFYTIPNLLCFITIFYLLAKDDFDYSTKFPKNCKYGLFITFILLLIYSNLYCSVIIMTYFGVELISRFIKSFKKTGIIEFIKKNIMIFVFMISWIISCIFELSGGRARQLSSEKLGLGGLLSNTVTAMGRLSETLVRGIDREIKYAFAIMFVVFIVTIIRNIIKKKKMEESHKTLLYFFAATIILFVGYSLLSAKVSVDNIDKIYYIMGFYISFLIFMVLCIAYLLHIYPKLIVFLPFLVLLTFFEYNSTYGTLKTNTPYGISYETIKEVDNYIIEQYIDADKNGLTEFELKVPEARGASNWPLPSFVGKRISNTLHRHGIISRPIKAVVVKDSELNERFNLSLYKQYTIE